MSQSKINILIDAVDNASKKLAGVGKSVAGLAGKLTKLGDVAKIAGGIMLRDLVRGATAGAQEAIKLGGSIGTLEASFNRLIKASGSTKVSLESLREATGGTVADVDLLKSANQALMLGLPTDEMNDLFEAAIKLGHGMGIDALSAVDSLCTGLGRQSKLVLDNLGVVFQAKDAYEWYATQLGKTAAELTETEKKLGWQKYAMMKITEQAEILGDVTSESQKSQERWGATIKNLKTSFGQLLGPLGAVTPALSSMMPLIGTMGGMMIPQLITQIGGLGAVTTAWATITRLAAASVSTSIYSIPIIGWIALAIAAIIGLYMAWKNNWFGIRDVLAGVVDWIMSKLGWLINGIKTFSDILGGVWSWITGKVEEETEAQIKAVETATEKQITAAEKLTTEKLSAVHDQLKAVQTGLDDELRSIETHHTEVTRTVEEKYAEQIDAANVFYDDLIGITDEKLRGIRDSRKKDLDDLELNYLLQKAVLDEAAKKGTMTSEEYQQNLNELNKTYRDQRGDMSDSYRIKELQAEKQQTKQIENIETERSNKIQGITDAQNKELKGLADERLGAERKANRKALRQTATLKREEQAVILQGEAEKQRIVAESKAKMSEGTEGWGAKITATIQGFSDSVLGIFGLNSSDVTAVWNDLWTGVQNFIADPIGTITSGVQGLAENMGTAFQENYEKTGDVWSSTWEALKTIPFISDILAGVQGIFDSIKGVVDGFVSAAFDWGKNLIQNFIDGITGMASGVTDAVSGIGASIAGFLGIGSPAKKGPLKDLMKWGPNLTESFAEGILSRLPKVERAAEGVADSFEDVSFEGDVGKMADKIAGSFKDISVEADVGKVADSFKELSVGGVGKVAAASSAGFGGIVINVNVKGAVDRRTAEYAAALMERRLRKVMVENTSPDAPTKMVRLRKARGVG